jgi:hypothetical protein
MPWPGAGRFAFTEATLTTLPPPAFAARPAAQSLGSLLAEAAPQRVLHLAGLAIEPGADAERVVVRCDR